MADDDGTPTPPPPKRKQRCSGSPAVNGCRRLRKDHEQPYCRYCGRPMEHHRGDDLELEEQGARRMAEARQAAEVPLTDLDRLLLDGRS